MEEQSSDVIQELVNPESEHVSEVEETQDAVQEEQPKEDPQEKNWRELRQALKELKRENQALRQEMNRSRDDQQHSEPEDDGDDEEIVTTKKLTKALSRIEEKLLEKEKETVEDRLRAKFSDFDDVFSQENVEFLQKHDPELVLSLRSLAHDPYKQAVAAYKMLKRTDHYHSKVSGEDKAKIAENKTKPGSVQAVRKQGALAEANKFANGLTPALKEQLWKEMQEYSKGS